MRDRCAHDRATRTRTAGGEHRRGWTQSQSAPVAQPSALLVVKTGRLRRRPSHNGKRRMPVIAGSVCTHLLPWGCHTIMELVLAALPVETTGALLRTGAMAEIAAILFCSCGYAGTSGADGLLFISRLLRRQIILSKCFFGWAVRRWRCTRGFARVGSSRNSSRKDTTIRRRVLGRAAEFTVYFE